MLLQNPELNKCNVAIIDGNNVPYTFQELIEASESFSKLIESTSLVFNLCQNTFESLSSYLGFLNNQDSTQVLLPADIDTELISELIINYNPNFIVLPKNRGDITQAHPDFNKALVLNEIDVYSNSPNYHFEINTDIALLLSTSGSTGSSKLVKLSYENIISNAQAIAEYLEISSNDRPITTLPMNYSFGLSIINSHLIKGATLILTESSITEKGFWDHLKRHEATTFGGVPFTFESLNRMRFHTMKLPSLKYLTQAGGKLRTKLIESMINTCKSNGMKFIVMYGQTEATARMSYMPWDKIQEKPNSVGVPIPGGKFRIINSNQEEIKSPNTTGELIYSGPNVFLGYSTRPEDLVSSNENHQELHTGDLAHFDSEGFYYITGRKSHFVKVFGNRINLADIEAILHKNEIESACIGHDEKLIVFTSSEHEPREVKRFISSKVKIHPTGIKVQQIDTFPRNQFGKIKYQELTSLYEGLINA
ncbi:MAG: AMP-dependent synthetase [Halobacteriovoraceae bacterium]|nr:AMP-dependent synthetase [Halobacteriovoraceae bacterium]|tara:strand:- start:493 stop:1929 length:1437 start_codon:yes stop_codon:yes gene_type:complete